MLHVRSMAQADDNLPLHRSYVEQRIGQLVGIFQIDRKRPADQARRERCRHRRGGRTGRSR